MNDIRSWYTALENAHNAGDFAAARQLSEAIRQMEAPVPKKGVAEAFKQGARDFYSTGQTAVGAAFGDANQAAQEALDRDKVPQYQSEVGTDLVKKAYNEQGLWAAAKEVGHQIPLAIAGQLPQIGAQVASGMAGAAVGSFIPIPIVGTTIGGLIGMALPSIAQQFGGNVERQAQEQQKAGQPIDINVGAAGTAAVPQALLDIAETRLLFGAKLFGGIIGRTTKEVIGMAPAAAEKAAKDGLLKTVAKGTARGVAAEVPTEVTQTMLERLQAGLPLTTPEALAEYGEIAYQAMLLGPMGIPGQLSTRSHARDQVLDQQMLAGAQADQAAQAQATAPAQGELDLGIPPPVAPDVAAPAAERSPALTGAVTKDTLKAAGFSTTFTNSKGSKNIYGLDAADPAVRDHFQAKYDANTAKLAEEGLTAPHIKNLNNQQAKLKAQLDTLPVAPTAPEVDPNQGVFDFAPTVVDDAMVTKLGFVRNTAKKLRTALVGKDLSDPVQATQVRSILQDHLDRNGINPSPQLVALIDTLPEGSPDVAASEVIVAGESSKARSGAGNAEPISAPAAEGAPSVGAKPSGVGGAESVPNIPVAGTQPKPAALTPVQAVAPAPTVTPAVALEPTTPKRVIKKPTVAAPTVTPEEALPASNDKGEMARLAVESINAVRNPKTTTRQYADHIAFLLEEPSSALALRRKGAAENTDPTIKEESSTFKQLATLMSGRSDRADPRVLRDLQKAKSEVSKRKWGQDEARMMGDRARAKLAKAVADQEAKEVFEDEQRDKPAQRYSQGEAAAPTGSTIASVEGAIEEAFGGAAFKNITTVVQKEEDLPPEIQRGDKGGIKGVAHNGHIWMVADNIAPGEALGVFVHEGGGHLGFDEVFKKDPGARRFLADQVHKWSEGDDLKGRVAKAAIKKAGSNNDEIIAYTTEGLIKAGVKPIGFRPESTWLNRVFKAFQTALEKIGLRRDITAQELVDAAFGAAHTVIKTPVAEGTIRVYRGETSAPRKDLPEWIQIGLKESGQLDAQGRWWTQDKKIAEWYRDEASPDGRVVYQDVPAEVVAKSRVSDLSAEIRRFSKDSANELFLPKEFVGKGVEGTRFSTADGTGNAVLDAGVLRRRSALTKQGDKPLSMQLRDMIGSKPAWKTLAAKFQVYVMDNTATVKQKLINAGTSTAGAWDAMYHLAFVSKSAELAGSSLITGAIKIDPKIGAFRVYEGVSLATVHKGVQKLAKLVGGKNNVEAFKNASDILDLGAIVLRRKSLSPEMQGMFKFSAEDIAAGEEALRLYGGNIRQIIDDWTEYKSGLLNANAAAGRFSAEDVAAWNDAPDFVPWFRVLDDAKHGYEVKSSARQFFSGLKATGKIHELMGGDVEQRPIGSILGNMEQLSFWLVNSAVRNLTATKVVNVLLNLDAKPVGSPIAKGIKNRAAVVSIYVNGVKKFFELGDELDAYAFMGVEAVTSPMLRLFATGANALRKGTTMMPGFVVSQVFQDSFRASLYSGAKSPFEVGAKVVGEFGAAVRGDDLSDYFLSMGIRGQADYIFEGEKSRVRGVLNEGTGAAKNAANKAWGMLDVFARASDEAQRRAVYKQTLIEGGSEALALYKAIEIINFQTRGASGTISVLRNVVPFMNAYLQGMSVAVRTMAGSGISATERSAAMTTFYMTAAKVAALSTLYAMLVSGDEEYEQEPDHTKMSGFIIPGTRKLIKELTGNDPGGNVKIPAPTDLGGLLFKTIPEFAYHHVVSEGTKNAVDAAKFMRQVSSAVNQTLSPPNAVPQLAKPVLELWANKSFFTGNPIIGHGMAGRAKEEQFTTSTTEMAKVMGQYLPLAPVQIDHLMRGTFGIAGGTSMFMASKVIDVVAPGERPDSRLNELPWVRTFLTGNSTAGAKEDYYELRNLATEVANTVASKINRSPQELKKYLEKGENNRLYGIAKSGVLYQVDTALGTLRKYKDMVDSNKDMSGERKREILNRIEEVEVSLLNRANIGGIRKLAGL